MIEPPETSSLAKTETIGALGLSAENRQTGQASGPSVTMTTPSGPIVGAFVVVHAVVDEVVDVVVAGAEV